MSPTLIQMILVGCAMLSAGCAVFVAVRSGKWRETDEAQALITRVGKVVTKVENLEDQLNDLPTKVLNDRLGVAENRISILETRVADLPSKADIEQLRGEIHAVCEIGKRTENAVDRIEGYMMKDGRP